MLAGHYAIRADHVTRDFGAVRALDSLSLEIPKGIVFGFLGPNGAGKTTAIRVLLGLLEPTSGRASRAAVSSSANRESRRQSGLSARMYRPALASIVGLAMRWRH